MMLYITAIMNKNYWLERARAPPPKRSRTATSTVPAYKIYQTKYVSSSMHNNNSKSFHKK